MPHAPCPMPHAPCPITHYQNRMNLEIQNLTGGLLGLFADSAYRDYS
jgi:hypothetical protein